MTTPGSGGGASPLRVGGLALIGVAVVAAVIGLASMAGGGGEGQPTAAPTPAPVSTPPGELAPEPVLPPGEAVPPPVDPGVPVPSFGEPAPGQPGPGEPQATPPGEDGLGQPAPGAPAPGQPAPGQPDPAQPAPGQPAPGVAPPPAGEAPAPVAPAPDPVQPAPAPQGSGPVASGGGGNGSGGGSGSGSRTGDTAGDGQSGAAAVRAPLRVYNNSTIKGLATRAAEDFRRAGWPIDEVGNYPHGIIPTSTVYYRPGTSEEAAAHALGKRFNLRVNPRFEGLKDASPGVIVIVTSDYGR